MLVPETTMNENRLPPPFEYYVGLTWYSPWLQPVPVSQAPEDSANNPFRLGIAGTDPAHPFAAFLFRKGVISGHNPLKQPGTATASREKYKKPRQSERVLLLCT